MYLPRRMRCWSTVNGRRWNECTSWVGGLRFQRWGRLAERLNSEIRVPGQTAESRLAVLELLLTQR
jgi:hypothetical protein